MGTVGFAVVNGLKKDPEICSRCGGTGGAKCFGCEGSGFMITPKDLEPSTMDFFVKSDQKNQCRVCKGCGMVLCRACKGSGYIGM